MSAVRRGGGLAALLASLLLPLFTGLAAGQEGDGVGAQDGDQLQAEDADRQTRARPAAVREHPFCELLIEAAKQPGQKFKHGEVEFVSHAPWVARLLCDFFNKATGAVPVFASLATEDSRRVSYEERRAYAGSILDAVQANADLQTSEIDRERILVGENIYPWGMPEETETNLEPQEMFVVRSAEDPASFLVGVDQEFFIAPAGDDLLRI